MFDPRSLATVGVKLACVGALFQACTCAFAQQAVRPLAAASVLAPIDAGWLVSAAEAATYQGQAGYDELAALRPRAVMPSIEVAKPDAIADTKVKAPFPIVVSFRGMADAVIDPSTFRVFYGALKIDITERITKHVKVTPTGFTFDKANIPSGRHRLTLQVQDSKQRVAERELRVEVE